jgi:A/G-specific adenine glycosylase
MAGPHFTPQQTTQLRRALLTWFDRHKRDLPWRRTRDPYAIWVSEIMLQQTRVAAVLDHYARWMARFPSAAALAAADESEVLALWSGLGYYRRARFLHAGAQAVMADHAGKLPSTAAALRTLPGIGEYTSAAIASIAFDEPIAVVDGNVERVMMRLAGLALEKPGAPSPVHQEETGKPIPRALAPTPLAREIRILANDLLAPERPGDANQAVMELGATVCLPRAPLCLHCPVQPWCATRGEHLGATRKAMQARSIAYALARREHRGETEVLLAQRPAGASLMPGMWELPELLSLPESSTELLTLRHAITVTNYTVRILACTEQPALESSKWVPVTQLSEIALTGLARKALKRLALWPQTVSH